MITQKEIENLTKEQALQLHKEMWLAMAEDPSVVKGGFEKDIAHFYITSESMARSVFKRRYMEERGLEVLNNCFLCEYALQQSEFEDNYCKHCPANWCGTEPLCLNPNYMCECDTKCNELDWRYSNIIDIANIKQREEM